MAVPIELTGDLGRVIVVAPLGRDAAIVCRTLDAAGVSCAAVSNIGECIAAIRAGAAAAAGAAVITEEALTAAGTDELAAALAGQPTWSDLPVVLLLAEGEPRGPDTRRRLAALRAAGNVTVLVRPVPSLALVTAVQSALRARRRQYEVRNLIAREHEARVEAEQANRLKDEFLATVSHELRTPLSAMLLWARLLGSGRVRPGQTDDAVQAIERSAEAQSRLIEDLLDVSRMLSGKLRLSLRRTDVASVAEAAVAVVRPMADVKRLRLDVTIDRAAAAAGPVLADADRLQQVLWNLLSNAVKFTPAGGTVSLDVRVRDDHVRVRVSDTGQGIEPQFLPHVFDRFRQADAATTRGHGGLGLGLAIARQLVELHGGTVTAESAGMGRGATFTIELPLARGRAAPGGEPDASDPLGGASRPPRLGGVRVLLVEDEPDTRQALAWVLQDAGADVTAVGSAAAALAALTSAAPHVLVSDIGMPGMDGNALIRSIRADERTAGRAPLPAVAISAYAREEDQRRAAAAGFLTHVAKPVEPEDLVAAVVNAVGAAPVTKPANGKPAASPG